VCSSDLAGKPRVNGAIVIVRNAKGDFIAAGARVELEGSGERFVVGYDGRIWMTNLAGDNRITVATGLASCAASFPYDPARGRRQTIGPLVCE
jgi:outer membrane usher protein